MKLDNLTKAELLILIRTVLLIRNIPEECLKQAVIFNIPISINPLVREHNELFRVTRANVARHNEGKQIVGGVKNFQAQLKRLNALSKRIDNARKKLKKLESEVDLNLNYFMPLDLWDSPDIPKSKEAIALDSAILDMIDGGVPALEVD